MAEEKKGISEDWLALFLGLLIFILSTGVFWKADILGWGAGNNVWTDISKSTAPISKTFQPVKGDITKIDGQKVTIKKADGKEETLTVKEDTSVMKPGDKYEKEGLSGLVSVILTYAFLLVLMGIGAVALRANVGKFAVGFTIVFWISYGCWLLGHYAYIAALEPEKMKIAWSLRLSPEAGFIIALLSGLIVGNFFPKLSELLKEATRPELYVKTAIVIMGAALGVKAAQQMSLASAVIFRGLCAIVEAYLIYWAVVYYIARKYFKFSKEWAAPLASGISICGVSAAIATGGAIRARPIVPIMVSSLVVIFAVIELIVLPFMAQTFLWQEPMVAGAWMGLAVKTDGAAVTSGAITDSLIRAKALHDAGINYTDGWITMTATTVKVFIDIFIGVWAFILAVVWCAKIECKPGEKVGVGEIWNRFPKFVLGYAATFILMLLICMTPSATITSAEKDIKAAKADITAAEKLIPATTDAAALTDLNAKAAAAKDKIKGIEAQIKEPKAFISAATLSTNESNVFRVMFFLLTFFTIGVVSNFKKLWEEGIGKLAAVYVLCLFGFIIWVGLIISWIFFHGVKPPIITG
ncbi:MAG TPA: putative sulfate exporter family transporter [Dissulfurispiraceae bacterium]|nr:putative sulfate exporter family transporter [Dissulfurispiraceae bacterium]